MNEKTVSNGKVFGATLLISGCCVGAGMLGLPVLTALGGFYPTLILFVLSWLFMATTGLLLLEVNLWFTEEVSIISMAVRTLGNFGRVLGWALFAFLFYSLMISYATGSGQLFADFVQAYFDLVIPEWLGSLLFSTAFGVFIYFGTRSVDEINRLLMVGLVVTYLALIGLGGEHVSLNLLKHYDWSAAIFALPAMIISFGFHNLVPSLTTYLNHDAKRLRFAIIMGSAIPLIIYLAWEWLILGIVPIEGNGGFREALNEGNMATRSLRYAVGSSWVVTVAEFFAFFAIVTSFISVALSFVDFLADGLHVKKNRKGKILLCILTLGPPFVLSTLYPKIFLVAMQYAGAFGAVILFGIMPALMVWSGRYVKKIGAYHQVRGGRTVLVLVILFSLVVFSLEIVHQLG